MFTTTTGARRRRQLLAVGGLAAAAALALSGCSGVTSAGGDDGDGEVHTFTLATGATDGTPNAAVQDWYLDRVEEVTEGRIKFERTATEALCKMDEVVECVRDGRAQIGVTVPDYTPQYFPSTSMVSIPFLNQNSQAIMQSIYDLHTDYEPAKAIMDKNGLHHVATWPVGRILFGSKEPLASTGDLAGLQARASGPIVQKVLKDADMDIVAITAAETYEAVERGVLNSIGGAIDFPVNYKIMELLPYWSDPGLGQYSTFGMWFAKDAYDGLPDDLKAKVDQVTEELNLGAGIEAFNVQAATQCQQMLDSPSVKDLTAWPESATAAWSGQVAESAEAAWVSLVSDQGLQDAADVLEQYKSGIEQYKDAEYTDATIDCVGQFASR